MLERFKDVVRGWVGPPPDDETRGSLEYSHEDIVAATNGFTKANLLGSGTSGAVYRGILRGGTEVAVKVLHGAGGVDGSFREELRVLSRFRHPNLVMLLGWGQNENSRYLVYELLSGGDVARRLYQCKSGKAPFPWQQRLRMMRDAACGLSHMMNSEPRAFHRDIKPANILLDAHGTAKMADFGLSGTSWGERRITVDLIGGTPGYACPAYLETGEVGERSEVFSFGVCLLEMLVNELPAAAPAAAAKAGIISPSDQSLVFPLFDIVQPAAAGAHTRVLASLDPRATWPRQLAGEVAELALSCVARPEARPLFEAIVQVLRRLCQLIDCDSAPLQAKGQVQAPAVLPTKVVRVLGPQVQGQAATGPGTPQARTPVVALAGAQGAQGSAVRVSSVGRVVVRSQSADGRTPGRAPSVVRTIIKAEGADAKAPTAVRTLDQAGGAARASSIGRAPAAARKAIPGLTRPIDVPAVGSLYGGSPDAALTPLAPSPVHQSSPTYHGAPAGDPEADASERAPVSGRKMELSLFGIGLVPIACCTVMRDQDGSHKIPIAG